VILFLYGFLANMKFLDGITGLYPSNIIKFIVSPVKIYKCTQFRFSRLSAAPASIDLFVLILQAAAVDRLFWNLIQGLVWVRRCLGRNLVKIGNSRWPPGAHFLEEILWECVLQLPLYLLRFTLTVAKPVYFWSYINLSMILYTMFCWDTG
jgi:hypothetical protein